MGDLDGGVYMLAWWEKTTTSVDGSTTFTTTATDKFRIANKAPDYTNDYKFFTTDGYAQVLGFEYASGDSQLTSVTLGTGTGSQNVLAKSSTTAGVYSEARVFAD